MNDNYPEENNPKNIIFFNKFLQKLQKIGEYKNVPDHLEHHFYNVYFKPLPNIDSSILALIEIYCYFKDDFISNNELYFWNDVTKLYSTYFRYEIEYFTSFWCKFIDNENYDDEDLRYSGKMKLKAKECFNTNISLFMDKINSKERIRKKLLKSEIIKRKEHILDFLVFSFPINNEKIISFEKIDGKYFTVLSERSRKDMFTKFCRVNYSSKERTKASNIEDSEIWPKNIKVGLEKDRIRKFISDFCYDINHEKHLKKIKLLKYMLGSSILGLSNKIYIFLGETAGNGKSTLLRFLGETLSHEFCSHYNSSLVMYNCDTKPKSDLESLHGLKAVIIEDTGSNFKLNKNVINKLTNNEHINVKNSFSFINTATVYIASVHSPLTSKWNQETRNYMNVKVNYFLCNSKFRSNHYVCDKKPSPLFYVDINDPYYFPEDNSYSNKLTQEEKDEFFEIIVEGALLYLNQEVEFEPENYIV